MFVPGYRDGGAPYGVWKIAQRFLPDGWSKRQAEDSDIGFATLVEVDGRKLNTKNVILAILEMYWLDQKKGDAAAWDTPRLDRLRNAAKAQLQLLTPDGMLSPLSDTYRGVIGPFWDRPRIILKDTKDFPAAKPRYRDVWLFGAATAGTMTDAAGYPSLPDRGKTYSMPQSGYYVMRSGGDSGARQIILDAGPTGRAASWSRAAQRSICASRPDGGSAQNCRPGWAVPR